MRKLLLVVFLLLPVSSFATALQITGGGISVLPGFGFPPDTFFNFGGAGFSVQGVEFDHGYLGGPTFGISIFDNGFPPTQVNVDGFGTCVPTGSSLDGCGFLQIMVGALPPVVDRATYLETAPFTASGQLEVGPDCYFAPGHPRVCTVFDIVGQGTLTMRYSNSGNVSDYEPAGSFRFEPPVAAPELSSLALLPLGLIGIVVAGMFRKRVSEG